MFLQVKYPTNLFWSTPYHKRSYAYNQQQSLKSFKQDDQTHLMPELHVFHPLQAS